MVGFRKDKDNIVRAAVGITRLGVVLGVGSTVVTRAGGSPSGLTTVSGFIPVGGVIGGSFITLGLLRGFSPNRRKRGGK